MILKNDVCKLLMMMLTVSKHHLWHVWALVWVILVMVLEIASLVLMWKVMILVSWMVILRNSVYQLFVKVPTVSMHHMGYVCTLVWVHLVVVWKMAICELILDILRFWNLNLLWCGLWLFVMVQTGSKHHLECVWTLVWS